MKSKVIRYICATFLLGGATQAFGLIDASLMAGKRSATWTTGSKSVDTSSIDVTLSGHIAPLPLPFVSIGLGLVVTTSQWDKDTVTGVSGVSATEAAGLDVGVETMVSVSVPFLATPYAKVAYSVSNKQGLSYEESGKPTVIAYTGSGYTIGLGAKFGLLPFISAMVEYSMFTGELTQDDVTVDGVAVSSSNTVTDVSSSTILVGVEVDIGL